MSTGVNVILDRYAYSGVAFTAAKVFLKIRFFLKNQPRSPASQNKPV